MVMTYSQFKNDADIFSNGSSPQYSQTHSHTVVVEERKPHKVDNPRVGKPVEIVKGYIP